MALRRIFVDSIEDQTARIDGTRAHHLSRVVRLRQGERVEVSDQTRVFEAVTGHCSGNRVEFDVEREVSTPPPEPPLVAAIAVFKFARFEWAVEKLTELGVTAIQPIISDRTDKSLAAAAEKRSDRWRRIVFEAAQQSRRVAAPVIHPPRSFASAISAADSTRAVIFDVDGHPLDSRRSTEALTFFVGPEGGWSDSETRMATDAGIVPATLGTLILRAETAAISAAAICRNHRSHAEK